MLLDTITLLLVIQSRNPFAAKQFLKELTHRTPDSLETPTHQLQSTNKNPVFNYQKSILMKTCALLGPSAQQWLTDLY
jgi:hypothetical protein